MTSESATAVRNAWYTVLFTRSVSPAPAKRAISTLMPVKTEEMNTITTRKICQLTPMAALAAKPT